MSSHAELGDIQIAAGLTNPFRGDFLYDNKDDQQNESDLDDVVMEADQDAELDQLYEESLRGEVNLDEIMASAMHANKSRGWTHHTLPRYGKLTKRLSRKHWLSPPNIVSAPTTPSYHGTMEQGIGCYDTNESTTTSSWTPFSPPRKEASRHLAIPVANCLLPTRASFMLCPCTTSLKSYKQSSCLQRKLELLMQSSQICLENRHSKISEIFVRRLAPHSSSLRKGLHGPTKPNSILD